MSQGKAVVVLYVTGGAGVNSCPFAIGSALAKIETAVSSHSFAQLLPCERC